MSAHLTAKWALVIAGVKDLSRPAEKLSVPQNLALAATGFIWVRYSLVITPVNYSLAAVSHYSQIFLCRFAYIWMLTSFSFGIV
jgi:hypothetical protein